MKKKRQREKAQHSNSRLDGKNKKKLEATQCLKMNPGWLPNVFFKIMPNCLQKYINQRLPEA